MTRPFRFGVITSNADTGAEWRDRARRAEDLGYTTLLMPDHYQPQWVPTVGLALAAGVTTTLTVGTLVFANDYRHPMMLAKELATLDLATEGRVEVGLGAGWRRVDYEQAGMTYDRAGVASSGWSSHSPSCARCGRHRIPSTSPGSTTRFAPPSERRNPHAGRSADLHRWRRSADPDRRRPVRRHRRGERDAVRRRTRCERGGKRVPTRLRREAGMDP